MKEGQGKQGPEISGHTVEQGLANFSGRPKSLLVNIGVKQSNYPQVWGEWVIL
jgi:hypothetical protein